MKSFLILTFLLNSILSNLLEIKVYPEPENEDCIIKEFTIFKNENSNENCIAVVYGRRKISSEDVIKIYNSNGELYFKKNLNKRCYHLFSNDNKLYFFSNYLYSYDVVKNSLDSSLLKRDDYFRLNLIKKACKANQIICRATNGLDIYDLPNLKLVNEIKYDRPRYINHYSNLFIIKSITKYFSVYDSDKKTFLWEYHPKEYPIKLYGINFGKIKDPILYCDFAWEKDQLFLYYTSGFGNMMKFDAVTGEIKLIKERFMGSGNNAGAIVNFKLADFNKDGHVDLVGPSVDHNVYCINGQDFSVIWKYNSGYENQSPISLYDITGDGVPEVFGVSDKMKLFIIDGASGNPIEEIVLSNRKDQSIVALCDFNGNECLDLVVKSDYNKIKVFEINSVKVQKNAIIQLPY